MANKHCIFICFLSALISKTQFAAIVLLSMKGFKNSKYQNLSRYKQKYLAGFLCVCVIWVKRPFKPSPWNVSAGLESLCVLFRLLLSA